jgi:hypothetical protein
VSFAATFRREPSAVFDLIEVLVEVRRLCARWSAAIGARRFGPLLDALQEGLVKIDAFDATLAAPAVGSGGGYYEAALHERFAALRDGVRSGITPVGWGCSASVFVLMSGVALELRRSHDHLASVAKFAMVAPMFFAGLHRCHRRRPGIDRLRGTERCRATKCQVL